MKYKYQARTREGEMQMGYVEAAGREAAVGILTSHDLYILSIESAEAVHWYDRLGSYFRGVRRKEMVIFTRQLATLLEAHLALKDALRTLREQTTHPVLREAIFNMIEDIDAGLSFSQALERQSTVFSDFFVSMVRTAEVTGNLEQVMGFLADYTEKDAVLVSKARSAMTYPAIVVALFIVVAIIMITSVFPQLKPIFEGSNVELPFLTRALLGAGEFFSKWWSVLTLIVFSLIAIALDYVRTPEGRAIWDDVKIRLPVVNKVYVPVLMARFSNTSGVLLKGGVPVAQAVEIVSTSVDNVLYRDILREASDAVRQGETLSQAIGRYPDFFPPLVPQMLAVGESTGRLDDIFFRLSSFYGREADSLVNNLVDLIQPVLMIGIGLLVGLMFASILLPLYQLTSTIQ